MDSTCLLSPSCSRALCSHHGTRNLAPHSLWAVVFGCRFLTYYVYHPSTSSSPSTSPCHSRSPSLGACSDHSNGSNSEERDIMGYGRNSSKWLAGLWGRLPAARQNGGPGSPASATPSAARSSSPPPSRQLSSQQSMGMEHVSTMYAAAAAAVVADAAGGFNPLAGAVSGVKAAPILFLHGVGGLGIYLEMIHHVLALGHPVLVVEFKHVAMRLW